MKGYEEAESKMKYLLRCNKDFQVYQSESKNIWVAMAVLIMIFIVVVPMFAGIKFFIKRRGAIIYGKYQRNCVTLSQTVHFVIFYIIFEVSFASSLNIVDSRSVSRYFVVK